MQLYAEESVTEHLQNLQLELDSQHKESKNAPFVNISKEETDKLLLRAMKASERWRVLKEQDMSDEDIIKTFDVKTKMTVFTWKGDKDTI